MMKSLLIKSRHVIRMQIDQLYVGIQHILSNANYYHNNNGWFQQLLPHEQPRLILDGYHGIATPDSNSYTNNTLLENLSIWFAVPKQKISHQKKRMKTTLRTRIPIRKNIITDPRTGELTLRHHLPYNWRNYLPNAIGMSQSKNKNGDTK